MISKYNAINMQSVTIPNMIMVDTALFAQLAGCGTPWYGSE